MRGIFLAALVVCGASVWAGTRVNNGGGAWMCRDKGPSQKLRWMRLVDLFEGKKELGLVIQLRPGVAPWDLFLEKAALVREEFPELQALMTTTEDKLQAAIKMLGDETELVKIKDGAWRVWPSLEQCVGGVMYYGQLANYTDDGRLLIASDLFNDPVFTDLHRGALYMHEYVYKGLRETKGDENSYRARLIVGTLFSDLKPEDMRAQIKIILAMPVSRNQPQQPLQPINLSCQMTVAKIGQAEGSMAEAPLVVKRGAAAWGESQGYRFMVEAEPTQGTPVALQIEDIQSGAVADLSGAVLAPVFSKYRWASIKLTSKSRGTYGVLNCWANTH